MDERTKALTAQIEKLQAENTFLKHLLDEVGISYVLPASKPTAEISKQLARRFYSYFWGRTDVYSKRSVNKTTGKAGYYPQCENLWKDGICPKKSGKKVKCGDCTNRKWRQLEAEQIMAHLRGEKPDGSDVIEITLCSRMGLVDYWYLISTTTKRERKLWILEIRIPAGWRKWTPCGRCAREIKFRAWLRGPGPGAAGICGFSSKVP